MGSPRGLAAPGVRKVLEDSEDPGTFEQFFRFAGRPSFVARNLLTGDFEGAARNAGQFLNEIFLGGLGAINPNWTLTGALDMITPLELPKDFTTKEQRPEFTDMLKRWGVADPRYMNFGEKLALDLVGGALTDPLSLVGGAPKGVSAASLKYAGGRFAAQRAAYAGLRSGGGKVLNEALDVAINSQIVRRQAMSRGPLKAAASNALGQFNAGNLEDMVKRASEFGLTPKQASKIVVNIQNKAAEALFFDNAAKAGVDLRGTARTFKPGDLNDEMQRFFDPAERSKYLIQVPVHDTAFPNATPATPRPLRMGEQSGSLKSIKTPTATGLPQEIFFHPRHTSHAKALAANHQALIDATALGRPPEEIARLHRDIGMKLGHSDEAIQETLRSLGLPEDVVTGVETYKRFLDEVPNSIIDEGQKALVKRGMTGDGISYFNPLKGEWKTFEWSSLAELTLPGQAMKLLRKYAPGAADEMTGWVDAAASTVMNRIYDRFYPTVGVDPSFSPRVRRRVYQAYVNTAAHADTARKVFMEKLTLEERENVTRLLDVEGDLYQDALHREVHLSPPVLSVVQQRLVALGGNDPAMMALNPLTRQMEVNPQHPIVQRLAEKVLAEDHMTNVKRGIAQFMPGREQDGLAALDKWREGMSQIPDYMRFGAKYEKDLKEFSPSARAAWKEATDNPFYIPHQISRRLHAALDEGLFNKNIASKINDVFSGAKEHRTRESFLEALDGLAEDVGIDLDDTVSLQNLDMAELYYRRMASFELTKARQGIYQDATKIMSLPGKDRGGTSEAYEFYINRVLHPTASINPWTGGVNPGGGARRNFFSKLLGGGRFTINVGSATTAEKAAAWGPMPGWDAKSIVHAGNHGVTFRFPGINSWYKPLLTSHPLNPKFVVRNILSSALMMQFLPGIGPEGFKQITPALLNHGMVRTLLKLRGDPKLAARRALLGPSVAIEISDGDYVSAVTRFLLGNTQTERDTALEFLKRSGTSVGPWSWDDAAPALRMVMGAGGGVNPSDLSTSTDLVAKLMPEVMSLSLATRADAAKISKARQAVRDYIAHGERLSNEVEARFRATAMLELLARGVDPHEAARQVTVAFVDYSKQSAIERSLRDVFPFARFMIGSTAWAKGMVEKPSGLAAVLAGKSPLSASLVTPQTLGLAQRSLSSQTEGEAGGGQFLPTEVAGTIALPLPWRDAEGNMQFLTSLGLPHEATLQIVGGLSGLDAARKNLLGSLQPAIRLPAEYVSGRSFYFGSDFGSYRKAPAYLEPFADKIPGRNGSPDRYEIPGTLNELMNATPLAGMQGMLDKFVDSRRSLLNKAFVLSTGVKVSSADLDREMKRRVAAYLKDKVESGQVGEIDAFFARGDPETVPEDLKIMLKAIAQDRAATRKANKSNNVKRGLGY